VGQSQFANRLPNDISAGFILRFTAGISQEEFIADEVLKRACIRAIES
jgi:uncharacterized protein with HEPN domain